MFLQGRGLLFPKQARVVLLGIQASRFSFCHTSYLFSASWKQCSYAASPLPVISTCAVCTGSRKEVRCVIWGRAGLTVPFSWGTEGLRKPMVFSARSRCSCKRVLTTHFGYGLCAWSEDRVLLFRPTPSVPTALMLHSWCYCSRTERVLHSNTTACPTWLCSNL